MVYAAFSVLVVAPRAHLDRVVAARDQIGQAVTILCARHGCTAAEAITRLVAASHAADLHVIDVVDWVITDQRSRHCAAHRVVPQPRRTP